MGGLVQSLKAMRGVRSIYFSPSDRAILLATSGAVTTAQVDKVVSGEGYDWPAEASEPRALPGSPETAFQVKIKGFN